MRSIDFLNQKVPDEVIEELCYKLEIVSLNQNAYLFESGKPWKELYIICNGELDVFLKNKNGMEMYLDTLYTGWSTGSYSVLTGDDYSISSKAKSDCLLIKLLYSNLDQLREQFIELDIAMAEYEDYIATEGLPYWDYKMYRSGHLHMKPIK